MFHNLQRLLDKAITETNAQYDPQYIISRLDVRLLTVSFLNIISSMKIFQKTVFAFYFRIHQMTSAGMCSRWTTTWMDH